MADSELVESLDNEPAVLDGQSHNQHEWICSERDANDKCAGPAVTWYLDPDTEGVFLAASGPEEWQRVDLDDPQPEVRPVPHAEVSDLEVDTDRISFDVDRVGTPVLVKASYFPNWQASGADGPYRVAPNLMVVVPTEEHVELSYGRQPVEWIGYALTLLGIGLAIFLATRPRSPGFEPEPTADQEPARHFAPAAVTAPVRRLALVALVPTTVDVGLLVVLRQGAGWILVLADLTAIAVASVVSYVLHRAYTFRSDPFVRWVRMPAAFIAVAAVAALVDVVVLRAVFAARGFDTTPALIAAKAVALLAAVVVRLVLYRVVLLQSVRQSLHERAAAWSRSRLAAGDGGDPCPRRSRSNGGHRHRRARRAVGGGGQRRARDRRGGRRIDRRHRRRRARGRRRPGGRAPREPRQGGRRPGGSGRRPRAHDRVHRRRPHLLTRSAPAGACARSRTGGTSPSGADGTPTPPTSGAPARSGTWAAGR